MRVSACLTGHDSCMRVEFVITTIRQCIIRKCINIQSRF